MSDVCLAKAYTSRLLCGLEIKILFSLLSIKSTLPYSTFRAKQSSFSLSSVEIIRGKKYIPTLLTVSKTKIEDRYNKM